MVPYKGFPIYNTNGRYKVEGEYFSTFTEAKQLIDLWETELFENEKTSNAEKTTDADR